MSSFVLAAAILKYSRSLEGRDTARVPTHCHEVERFLRDDPHAAKLLKSLGSLDAKDAYNLLAVCVIACLCSQMHVFALCPVYKFSEPVRPAKELAAAEAGGGGPRPRQWYNRRAPDDNM
eukprot:GHVU01060891.1.p2 GENE.GHVU01060891.1~~GHVU01060891.1.p2  ORF type:complete len:120 (-),score=9.01 GHVU01060891.1:299-658(-)